MEVDGDNLNVLVSFPPMTEHKVELDDEFAVGPGVWITYAASGEIALVRVQGAVSVDVNPEGNETE